jgi:excisionase family DNA binding protein
MPVAQHANSSTIREKEGFLSVSKSAETYSVSQVTIRRLLTQGKLRRFKFGGRTLIKASDLQALIEEVK